jgi:diguanylate cyclase (GGDEF)-like protein/PAS domain S-box-containing protein
VTLDPDTDLRIPQPIVSAYEALLQFLYLCPVGIAEMNESGDVSMINPMASQLLLPLTPTRSLDNLFALLDAIAPALQPVLARRTEPTGTLCDSFRILLPLPPGAARSDVEALSVTIVRIEPGRLMAVIGDVTTIVRQQRQLRQDDARFRAIFEGVHDYAFYSVNAAGLIDSWNRSGERLFAYGAEDVMGSSFERFFAPDNPEDERRAHWSQLVIKNGWLALEGWRERKDGSRFWGETLISIMAFEGGPSGFAVVDRDSTESKAHEDHLRALATTDVLTGLPNRRLLFETGKRAFDLARRHGTPLSLLMLDGDKFKTINDTYGHPAGDAVLRRIAELCRTVCRTSDLPARYGGEEFVILLPMTSGEGAREVAERLRAAAEDAVVEHDGKALRFTVSIGVAAMDGTSASLEMLIEGADAALYRAKESGRNRVVCFHDP